MQRAKIMTAPRIELRTLSEHEMLRIRDDQLHHAAFDASERQAAYRSPLAQDQRQLVFDGLLPRQVEWDESCSVCVPSVLSPQASFFLPRQSAETTRKDRTSNFPGGIQTDEISFCRLFVVCSFALVDAVPSTLQQAHTTLPALPLPLWPLLRFLSPSPRYFCFRSSISKAG
jgi:hypothetical protein